MNPRLIESLKKLKEQQTILENEIKKLQNEIKQMQIEMPEKIIDDAQEGLKNYSIINGYWHLDDENLGIKAEGVDGLPGKDGKDGRDGRDGLNGLPGKMGLPGKDGIDGKDGAPGKDGLDGKDGKDGVDGITPEFEVGEIKSVSTYDPAKVELIKNENKYIINMDIPRGRPGANGSKGADGSNGHTPIKGTDYYTESDKQEMVQMVIEELPPTEEVDLTPYAKKEDIPDVSNFIEDEDYVHTDNNFTDEDKSKLDGLENFSGNASDVTYEDNYDNDVADVQEAIDIVFAEINSLNETKINEYVNATIDLSTLPVGVYYLKGTQTKIKCNSNKIVEGLIKSDDQKSVLIALGTDGTKGKGVLFNGAMSSTQVFIYVFGNGTWTNYNLFNFITSSRDETITGGWKFNTTPQCINNPVGIYQLTNKRYVDNRFYEAKYATDLGYIDLDDYDGDVFTFMNTIKDEGRYKFIDSYDDFEWYVEVYRTDYYAGQTYWGSEEGYANRYFRYGYYNEDEDIVEWYEWDSYLNYSVADSLFKRKTDVDYVTISVADLRTWLDEMKNFNTREYDVIQTSNGHKFMVNIRSTAYNAGGKARNIRYQEYYDIEEPNKIYKRTGTSTSNAANQVVTWGSWYVFEGTPEE